MPACSGRSAPAVPTLSTIDGRCSTIAAATVVAAATFPGPVSTTRTPSRYFASAASATTTNGSGTAREPRTPRVVDVSVGTSQPKRPQPGVSGSAVGAGLDVEELGVEA